MEAKKCTGCKSEKPFSDFPKMARTKSGLNPRCKECVNKKNRDYYSALPEEKKQYLADRKLEWSRSNPEKRAEEGRRYRAKESAKEKAAERQKRFRRENPEASRLSGDQYRRRNLGKFAAKEAARRADIARRSLGGSFLKDIESFYIKAAAMSEQGVSYHVDHIVPLRGETVSGLHVPWNLQVITAAENLAKSNHFKEEA